MIGFADDAHAQDLISPVRVEHRVAFGDPHRGREQRLGCCYNIPLYEFLDSAALASAIHELDEADCAVLPVHKQAGLNGEFARRVVVFLSMRYDRLEVERGRRREALDASLQQRMPAGRTMHGASSSGASN